MSGTISFFGIAFMGLVCVGLSLLLFFGIRAICRSGDSRSSGITITTGGDEIDMMELADRLEKMADRIDNLETILVEQRGSQSVEREM